MCLAALSAKPSYIWGGVLILMGVLLQLDELGISRVGIQTIWPIFIIGIGVVLVMQALQSRGGGSKTGMGGRVGMDTEMAHATQILDVG